MSDHDTSSNWTYPLSLHDALPIFLKRLAYAGTAHPGTIDGQSTTITDGKPQLRAQFAQQGEITDAITAKPEVVPHNQVLDPSTFNQQLLHKSTGGQVARRPVKAQAPHPLHTGGKQR